MPITKKTLLPLGLAEYDVYIEDTSENSEYFRISRLPSAFSGGRNSFLLGGSNYLQNNSEIQIEILDAQGETIYQSLVNDYDEGTSKMMSVEIYDTTAPGFATIIVMGKVTQTTDGTNIPEEWRDVYNVRWSKRILVDYNLKNTSRLVFKNPPDVTVEEKRFYNINSSSYDTKITDFTASLRPILYSGIQIGYNISAEAPTTFSADYYNGIITGTLNLRTDTSTSLNLPIVDILNKTTAFSRGELITSTINDGIIRTLYLRSGSYTASLDGVTYPVTTSAKLQYYVISTSSVNIPISYASLRISNLNTVSGELYKFRVYNKVSTNGGDYKIVGDVYVDTSEILISSSIRGNIPIGDIYTCINYQDNWYAGKLQQNSTSIRQPIYAVSGSPTYYNPYIPTDQFAVSSSDDVLMSSIYVDVPVDTPTNRFIGSVSQSGYFIGTKQAYTLFPTTEYTLTLDSYYRQTSESVTLTGNTPKVDIYIIGTGSTKVADRNPLGQKIGELLVSSKTNWFQQEQFNFRPNISSTGNVGLRFVVPNGFWNFSNISIKPAADEQFSPDEALLLIPNIEYHNDLLQYKVEFFDVNSNSSTIDAISTPVFFTGSAIDFGTLP